MNNLKYILLFVALFYNCIAIGQQDGYYALYMFNEQVVNPAHVGVEDEIKITGLYKRQWMEFAGAPEGQSFSINAPMGYKKLNNVGIGLHFINDRFGPNKNTGTMLDLSYKLKLGAGKLSVGLRGGLKTYSIDLNQVEYPSGYDGGGEGSWVAYVPTMGLGIGYYIDNVSVGIVADNLFEPKLNTKNTSDIRYGSLYRNYMFTTGYGINFNENFRMTPSIFIRYAPDSPVDFQGNLNFLFLSRFWFGIGALSGASAVLQTGVMITKNLRLGYAFSGGNSKTSTAVGASHEFLLSYAIKKKKAKVVLKLITEDSVDIMTAIISKDGTFSFEKLPESTSFLFKLESEDPNMIAQMEKVRVKYLNAKGEEVVIEIAEEKDKYFRFTHLELKEDILYALNAKNDTLGTAVRNEEGFFVFTYLPSDPNLIFIGTLDAEADEEMIIYVNGVEQTIEKGAQKFFVYSSLPVGETKLFLISKSGDTLSVGLLNDDGFFVFESLPAGQNHLFLLETTDAKLIEDVQVLYKNDKGKNSIITVSKGKDQLFHYDYLEHNQERLYLIGINGDTLMSSLKNSDGFYIFEKLPLDQNYIFKLEEKNVELIDDLIILVGSEKGKEQIIKAVRTRENAFSFEYLDPLAIKNPELINNPDVPVVLTEFEKKIVTTAFESLKFNTGESIIHLESYTHLEKLSELLLENSDWKIRLTGYTDDVGTINFNLLLSKRRAETVKKALVKRGVPLMMILVSYFGEEKPIADNKTEEGRSKNRRVEMVILQ